MFVIHQINSCQHELFKFRSRKTGRLRLSSRRLLANVKYYKAEVCWQMSNTIKQMSVGKCQILSSRCMLANLKYYQADDVNLGFKSELKVRQSSERPPQIPIRILCWCARLCAYVMLTSMFIKTLTSSIPLQLM